MKESHLTPEKRKKYEELLKEAQKNPEENKLVIQIATLVLELDDKGEYWKAKYVFEPSKDEEAI